MSAEARIAATGPVAAPQARAAWGGVARLWPLVLGVLGLLGVLAMAETVWLKTMPGELAVRKSLLVIPAGGTADAASWAQGVLELAREAEGAIAAGEGDASVDETQRSSSQAVSVIAQCIQVSYDNGRTVEGLLVSATVRGEDHGALAAIADEWASSLASSVPASYPFLLVQASENSATQYGACGY